MNTSNPDGEKRERLILGAICAYIAIMSYGVFRAVPLAGTPRQAVFLKIGWGAVLLGLLALVLLGLLRKGAVSNLMRKALSFALEIPLAIKAVLFLVVTVLPGALVYSGMDRGLLTDDWLMLSLILPLVGVGAITAPFKQLENLAGRAAFSALSIAFVLLVAAQFSLVNDYPFSIGWSEGNRFYDYSLVFGRRLYQSATELEFPYGAPGRYGLWGIWFLFGEFPIEFHRAWNAVLWFLPSLLFGWFAAQRIGAWPVRLGITLWVVLFLDQGPIYAPLLIAATLVALPMHHRSLWVRALFLALAGWYVGLSRWTWAIVSGAWGGLIDLYLYYPKRTGNLLKRLLPVVLAGLAGVTPGILANLNRILAPQETTLSLSQPLLWYRLFPNSTYQPGILLGLLIAAGPLIILAAWFLVSRRDRLDGLQLLATSAVLAAFLAAGLVASTKIGGGSNLHNLDMFLVTLTLLVLVLLAKEGQFAPQRWPIVMQALLLLVITIPAIRIMNASVLPDPLPDTATIKESLERIEAQVDLAQKSGDVLFMDQRQLLTFGFIKDTELVDSYEKKYLMDQAMAGNSEYFEAFYEDLKNLRFTLIVSEPLFTRLQDTSVSFAEENNAWVTWVSEPILCFYRHKSTLREVGVQLLVPREQPANCQLP